MLPHLALDWPPTLYLTRMSCERGRVCQFAGEDNAYSVDLKARVSGAYREVYVARLAGLHSILTSRTQDHRSRAAHAALDTD